MQNPLPLLTQDQILEVEYLLDKITQAEKNNNQTELQQLSQQLEAIYQSALLTTESGIGRLAKKSQ